MTSLAPIRDGFFNEPGLGVVLGEELGLSFHKLGREVFERFRDLRMQSLA